MISWLKRVVFGRPSKLPEVTARRDVVFDMPRGFMPVAAPPLQAKPHYEPPIVRAFQTSDNTINVQIMTEHDHDGLDYHRKDAKRMVTEVGGTVAFMHFLEDGYSLGASMGPGRNLHRCVKVFSDPQGASIIGAVDIYFQAKTDPRVVDLIRTASDRLSFSFDSDI